MRIAFVLETFPKLSETFILHQVTGLIDLGYEVDIFPSKGPLEAKIHPKVKSYGLAGRIFYPPSRPSRKWVMKLKGIWLVLKNTKDIEVISRILALDADLDYKVDLLYSLLPFLDKKPYEIFHCHFGPFGRLAVLGKVLGVTQAKLFLSFYGYDATRKGLDSTYYSNLIPWFDGFITISRFLRSKLLDLGIPEDKLMVIPLGINLSEYPLAPSLKSGKKLLTVARLVEKKGIYYGIMAFFKLISDYPDLEYHIAGDGVLFDKLNELIDELGLNGKVFLHGAMDHTEIKHLYAVSDIFLLPSITASDGNSEGQGLVLQEAQIMGLPVVASLHNGIPEGMMDGKTGFLVPERDTSALAQNIGKLLNDETLRKKMGENGRKFVISNFDNLELIKNLSNYYSKIGNQD
ncbi:glycosyltransferase [Pleomorphovibrio marinus]|uniref:glycosyltransferase n=1 Tax=Pleomorphovibrio marinus TaxID=2164132 RepID=UPI0018E50947|nr:glycosyltransferase [Pleomorphovibrio marinus]